MDNNSFNEDAGRYTSFVCKKCGSSDYYRDGELYVCKYCRTKYQYVKRNNGTDSCNSENRRPQHKQYVIDTTITRDDFIRNAWIQLYIDNAPADIFECNFSNIQVSDHEVFQSEVLAIVNYSASIGYDYKEPYLATEEYYEQVPVGVVNGTTRYERVKKTRQVTKYRFDTRWESLSGSNNYTANVYVQNDNNGNIDLMLYKCNLGKRSIFKDAVPPARSIEGNQLMDLHEETLTRAQELQEEKLLSNAEKSLPGDHVDQFFGIVSNVEEISTGLYKVQEYRTTINFRGKNYVKKCYPFNDGVIGGANIDNSEVVNKQQKFAKKEKIKSKLLVWGSTILLVIVGLAIIIVLLGNGHTTAAVILLPLSISAALVASAFISSKVDDKENSAISENNGRVRNERLELLNRKLASLSLRLVEDYDEIEFRKSLTNGYKNN